MRSVDSRDSQVTGRPKKHVVKHTFGPATNIANNWILAATEARKPQIDRLWILVSL